MNKTKKTINRVIGNMLLEEINGLAGSPPQYPQLGLRWPAKQKIIIKGKKEILVSGAIKVRYKAAAPMFKKQCQTVWYTLI